MPRKSRLNGNVEDENSAGTSMVEVVLANLDRKLLHLDQQEKRLKDLLSGFIRSGQGSSALLLGPRNSGKSALVKAVLSSPTIDQNHWLTVIRVDGLACGNEKEAMKQLEPLEHINQASRFLVVIDHFDRFAYRSNHQYLLYSVLDASRRHSIFVLGLSNRVDAYDLLEKRVKSRFSNVRISCGFAMSLEQYEEAFLGLLNVAGQAEYNEQLKTDFDENDTVQETIERVFETDSSIATLKRLLVVWLNLLRKNLTSLKLFDSVGVEALEMAANLIAPTVDPMEITVKGLTLRQLLLLIIIVRQVEIKRKTLFSYKYIATVFRKFCNENANCQMLLPAIEDELLLYKELDHLLDAGLLSGRSLNCSAANQQLAFRMVQPALNRALLKGYIVDFHPLPEAVRYFMDANVDRDH